MMHSRYGFGLLLILSAVATVVAYLHGVGTDTLVSGWGPLFAAPSTWFVSEPLLSLGTAFGLNLFVALLLIYINKNYNVLRSMSLLFAGMFLVMETAHPAFTTHLSDGIIMALVVMLAVVLIAAAVLMVFGTTIYRAIQDRWPLVAALLINFKSLVSFVMLFFFFTLLYSFVPRRRVKLRHNLLGAVFGAGGWVLFSYFFSLFVENFSNFSIYGSLATLVIMMFWLFFCMYILFLGGEVSMWLEQSGVGEDIRNLLRGKPKRYKIRRSQTKATVEKEETE